MENTSVKISLRDMHYYRARQKNRIFEALTSFYADRAAEGLTKRLIAEKLDKDPSQITRWLSQPSNLTLDTISDLLLAMDAEMDFSVGPFSQHVLANDIHPWANDYLRQHKRASGHATIGTKASEIKLSSVVIEPAK